MKPKLILNLIAAASLCSVAAFAGEPEITAHTVALDAVHEYQATLDQIILTAVETKGKFSLDPNELAKVRALEYELLGHSRLGVLKKSELPALVFAEGKPQSVEEIPGRALELRLLKLDINPWEDGLSNKVFQYDARYVFRRPVQFRCACPTNQYPQSGNFQAAYSYGMALIAKRDWREAASHLADAADVPGGTVGGVWEFQIEITRAWAQLMSGDFSNAKATLAHALTREHQCEVPTRARFLARVLGIGDQHLTSEVAAALPNEN